MVKLPRQLRYQTDDFWLSLVTIAIVVVVIVGAGILQ